MGEVLARRALSDRAIAGVVRSAGTEASEGAPATEAAQAAVHARGLDLSSHLSRPVTSELVAAADLVLCMEPTHVVDVVQRFGGRFEVTFTVPELGEATARVPGRRTGELVTEWLGRATDGRTVLTALSAPSIPDPTGRSNRHHRATAASIADALTDIFDGLVSS